MFKRKPYRKGKTYFYVIHVVYGQSYFNRRGLVTPTKHLSAVDVHEWCLRDTLIGAGYPDLEFDKVSVQVYHIEPN
jgi:hypothetical protein